MGAQNSHGAENSTQLLLFQICNQTFGIDISNVKEIIKCCPITRIPGENPRRQGVFANRDEGLVHVVDFKYSLFNEKSEPQAKEFLILLQLDDCFIGFQVENVTNIITEDATNTVDARSISIFCDSYITDIVRKDDDLVGILNYEKIIKDAGYDEWN